MSRRQLLKAVGDTYSCKTPSTNGQRNARRQEVVLGHKDNVVDLGSAKVPAGGCSDNTNIGVIAVGWEVRVVYDDSHLTDDTTESLDGTSYSDTTVVGAEMR